MSKCIVIKNCGECPYRSHLGGFGRPRYAPSCIKGEPRALPYDGVDEYQTANATNVIPDWCPLTNFPKEEVQSE